MFINPEDSPSHLLLLPGANDAERAAWAEAALDYALAFGGVTVQHELAGVNWSAFRHVTLVNPPAWPPQLAAQVARASRTTDVDVIPAPTPDALRAVLNVRVYYGWRYGPQTRQEWAALWPPGGGFAP